MENAHEKIESVGFEDFQREIFKNKIYLPLQKLLFHTLKSC